MDKGDFQNLLRHYREEDRHECNLINHRMVWLVTCQSFFITSYAIAFNNSNLPYRLVFTSALVVVGCFTAVKLGDAVVQAERIIKKWHTKEGKLEKDVENLPDTLDKKYFEKFFIGRNWLSLDEEHEKAFAFQRYIKHFLITIWILLAILTLLINLIAPIVPETALGKFFSMK